jgi:hypothetical protein
MKPTPLDLPHLSTSLPGPLPSTRMAALASAKPPKSPLPQARPTSSRLARALPSGLCLKVVPPAPPSSKPNQKKKNRRVSLSLPPPPPLSHNLPATPLPWAALLGPGNTPHNHHLPPGTPGLRQVPRAEARGAAQQQQRRTPRWNGLRVPHDYLLRRDPAGQHLDGHVERVLRGTAARRDPGVLREGARGGSRAADARGAGARGGGATPSSNMAS